MVDCTYFLPPGKHFVRRRRRCIGELQNILLTKFFFVSASDTIREIVPALVASDFSLDLVIFRLT